MLLIAVTMPALAQSVIIDKIEYLFLEDGKAVVLKGIDCYGDVTIRKSVTIDGEECTVTEILRNAFKDCDAMTSIRIPETITRIWNYAFLGCENLREVHISDLKAWCNIEFMAYDYDSYGCSPFIYADQLYLNDELITDLVIPDGVTKLSNCAFSYLKCLKSVTICDSMTTIEKGTFSGCSNLTSITIPPSITSINSPFEGCKNLEEVHISDLTTWCRINFIDGYYTNPLMYAEKLYLGDELITDLNIPDAVNTIKYEAFYGYNGLRTLSTGNSLEYIASRVFMGCDNLTSVIIGSSIKGIGDYAFSQCRRLKSIVCLSEKPCGLGKEVFTDYISTLYVPVGFKETYQNSDWSGFKNIVEFDPALIEEANLVKVGGIMYSCDPETGTASIYRLLNVDGDVTIQDSVTLNGRKYNVIEIGDNVFSGSCEMISISIPDSVVKIGDNAFGDCAILMSASIGNSVTTIGEKAFYGCYSLLKLTLGKSVTSIGDYAFYINRLAEIYCLNETPCTVGNNVFRNYNATLYVPEGSIDSYRSDTEWGKFKDIRGFEASETEITTTDVLQLPTDYYTISGIKVATAAPGEKATGIPAGIYISRRGDKTQKTVIR